MAFEELLWAVSLIAPMFKYLKREYDILHWFIVEYSSEHEIGLCHRGRYTITLDGSRKGNSRTGELRLQQVQDSLDAQIGLTHLLAA